MKTYSKLKLLIHPRDCECNPAPGSQAHVSRLSCQFPDPGLIPPAWVRSSAQRAARSGPVCEWTSINTSGALGTTQQASRQTSEPELLRHTVAGQG